MNELVREIEEDIRRERVEKLWHSFGKLMVGVSIAIILVTIGVVVVQDRRNAAASEKTAEFLKGIDRINIEDYKGAIEIFGALARDPQSSYYGPAMLRKAQAEVALQQEAEAKKTYSALAAHGGLFAPLGKVLSYGGSVQADETLEQPASGSPLYFTQAEFRGWQLLQQGKKDDAVATFLQLYRDPASPRSMRERLLEVLQHIAPEKLNEKALEAPEAEKTHG